MSTSSRVLPALAAVIIASALVAASNSSTVKLVVVFVLGLAAGVKLTQSPWSAPLEELLSMHNSSTTRSLYAGILERASGPLTSAPAALLSTKQYGFKHGLLNMQPPSTSWFNMGYWNDEDGDCSEGGNTTADGDNSKGDEAVDVSEARNQRQQPTSARPNNSTSVYQRACQRLIDKVVRASGGVGPSTRVLDVGYGCGDQDLYLYDKYDCWHIDGITLEPAQHQLAQAHTRIRRLDDTILLRTGDAADPNDDSGVWQSGQKYDRIFAIDCAYHFATRDQFLSNVANSLESGNGSTFVAADILPTFVPDQTDSVGRFIMRVISKVAGVPVENMYTADEYRIKLEKLGFEQVRIEDITSNVFPGLADYIEDHISTMSSVVRPSKTLPLTVMKWILRFLYEQQWCQFVIISAKMP